MFTMTKQDPEGMETIHIDGGDVRMSEIDDQPAITEVKSNNDYFLPERNAFLERQAKRVARNPCTHLCTSLLLGIALSVIAMIVGEFSISANSGGWQSRGTLIADRQTQLMLVDFNQENLLYGGEEVWDELINNVQPGWEDDDDDATDEDRRRLTQVSASREGEEDTSAHWLTPRSDRLLTRDEARTRKLPFEMTPALQRRLQDQDLPNCDMGFYTPTNLTDETHLWPLWEVQSSAQTALDPDVIRDICVAEQETQRHLEAKGLCFGCEEGCLPPYSVVFYARLVVDNGMTMSCDELRDAWAPLQTSTEEEWKTCVEDIKSQPGDAEGLPESCPEGFMPTLVAESFDITGKTRYTSSIFATHWSDIDELYEEVEEYDRGSGTVEGAYDTQYEDFVNLYIEESLNRDMALAMGSAVVVSAAILLHTRSPLLTAIGLTQIVLSFPLSYFVYKLVAGLEFFPFLNFIGIFVVFALGAGDVFVAVDKWKNARLEYPKASTEYVAAVALPDAASAMFLTTLTTAVAFFATAICPVAPVQMFAIFCGLLIVFDYIMNVLLVFPALCIYDRALFQSGGHGNVNCCISCSCFGFMKPVRPTSEDDDDQKQDDEESDVENGKVADLERDLKPSLIRRILLGFYDVLHYARWPLFVASLTAFGVSVYFASTLELPTSSDVRLLAEKSQFEQNYVWRQNLLSKTLEKEGGSQAFVIWGVKPADTGDQSDPGSWSQLVLDPDFFASSEESQLYLHDFCDKLFAEDFASTIHADYSCPMQRFNSWLEEESAAASPDPVYTHDCANATGIPVDPHHFDACIGNWARAYGETSILLRHNKVQVMFLPFVSRIRYDGHYDELDDEWNMIENWMDRQNRAAPSNLKNGYFSSFDFWWYDTNGQMLSTAYSAAGIALACSALVILFSSRSVTLTVFSTLTIGYVLTSVTATLVAMGWTLGFLESICFAILIGVSVDFVIHFSHAYATLPGDADRGRRTKYALIQMGPSILATATTTILSAVIMLFTVITFFQKFALILFFTVIQASAGSFIIFLVLVDCIGPTNPTYLVDKVLGSMGKGKKDGKDEDDDREESERTIPVAYGTPDASERTASILQGNASSAMPAVTDHDEGAPRKKKHKKKRTSASDDEDHHNFDMASNVHESALSMPPFEEEEDFVGVHKKHKKKHQKKAEEGFDKAEKVHSDHDEDSDMPYFVSMSPPASPDQTRSSIKKKKKKKHHHHHHHMDPDGFSATE